MAAPRFSKDSGYRDVFDIYQYHEKPAPRHRRDFPLILYDLEFPADPFEH